MYIYLDKLNNDFQLIVSDLDGTLLDDNKEISPNTFQFLDYLHKQGLIIVFATARAYLSAQQIAHHFKFNIPLIVHNGAQIMSSHEQNLFFERRIPLDLARCLITEIKKEGLRFRIYSDSQLFVEEMDQINHEYVRMNQIPYEVQSELEKNLIHAPHMIVINESEEKLSYFMKKYHALSHHFSYTKSESTSLEFLPKGISKGYSLKLLCREYAIPCHKVIAFGNNFNDLSMLTTSGLGIAMSNSPLLVQQNADRITGHNHDEGVLHMLQKVFLPKKVLSV